MTTSKWRDAPLVLLRLDSRTQANHISMRMCVFLFVSLTRSLPIPLAAARAILKWLKSTDAPTCPCCKAPALGDDSPVDTKRESSPEADWWHT